MEDEGGWLLDEAAVIPNCIHLLILWQNSNFSLGVVLNRFKGRSAHLVNQALGNSGRFWQEDWFDRLMCHEGELTKTTPYISQQPSQSEAGELVERLPLAY